MIILLICVVVMIIGIIAVPIGIIMLIHEDVKAKKRRKFYKDRPKQRFINLDF